MNMNTPITKLLAGSLAINTTIASILDVRQLMRLQLQSSPVDLNRVLSLAIWQLACTSTSELVVSALTLYNARAVERFMGTRRFAAFVAIVYTMTSVVTPVVLVLLKATSLGGSIKALPFGMIPTIFAILYQYQALIPSSTLVQLSPTSTPAGSTATGASDESTNDTELVITDKIWTYGMALQLATFHHPISIVGASIGWLMGGMYHAGYLPNSWRLPSLLTSIIESKPANTTIRPVAPEDDHIGRSRTSDRVEPAPRRQVSPPSEADIETLTTMMSISREMAIEALNNAGNSVERAVENMLMT